MALHLFRPNEPAAGDLSPSWKLARVSMVRTAGRFLRRIGRPLFTGRRLAFLVHGSVLAAGLLGQVVLLWLAGEMLDLYVSAVELWAELARKHLELQLTE